MALPLSSCAHSTGSASNVRLKLPDMPGQYADCAKGQVSVPEKKLDPGKTWAHVVVPLKVDNIRVRRCHNNTVDWYKGVQRDYSPLLGGSSR